MQKYLSTSFFALVLSILQSEQLCTGFSSFVPAPSFNTMKRLDGRSHVSHSPALFQSSLAEDEREETMFDGLSETATDIFILALRVGTCSLMIHHGFDKVKNVDGFSANVVAKFFGFLPGDPKFWTLSAAVTQIVGSGLLTVGILARPVALSMLATMATAVIFHLLNTGPEGFPFAVIPAHSYNFELASMYVLVLGYFSVAGAGAYSVDEKILGGELQFYDGLVQKVFGDSEE